MGFSALILKAERIREGPPVAGLPISCTLPFLHEACLCEGQRREEKSQSKLLVTGQLRRKRKFPLRSAGLWWGFSQYWDSLEILSHFLPCPPPGSDEACGFCVVFNSKGKQYLSLAACKVLYDATTDSVQLRALLSWRLTVLSFAPRLLQGGLISSDKWKALRNVSCPLKIQPRNFT